MIFCRKQKFVLFKNNFSTLLSYKNDVDIIRKIVEHMLYMIFKI